MEMSETTAVVAGAASGLGAATAKALIRGGSRVAICDIDSRRGEKLVCDLGDSAAFFLTDVSDEFSVQETFSWVLEKFGMVNAAINCAGILKGERILGKEGIHRLSTFRRVLDVNLIGTFNVIRFAASAMRSNTPNAEGEKGVIVNTASIAAYEGQVGQSAYSASKAGVLGLTLTAARELASEGIRVCTIAPGVFDTEMLAGIPESFRQALAEQVPFPRRLGKPEEYAKLVKQILENPMLNGEAIRLDGALRMAAR